MMNTKANRVALIPARLESQRLPEKLLLSLGGAPIIVRTYRAVLATDLFHKVVVICNHSKIAAVLEEHNCDYIYNDTHFESGTDRIANELNQFPYEVVVNVQGDEPFIEKSNLINLVELFDNKEVEVSTLKYKINSKRDYENPNVVKVVCNENGRALFFSRSPIPFFRDENQGLESYRHIGVYGYRRSVLMKLSKLGPSALELSERLENLRMIEHGFYVGVAEVSAPPMAIDTPEDYEQAIEFLGSKS
jgi:3-deoxy-manno-octulosonate cytidylyltransferase (CMP-KDO synthetase)